MNKHIIIRKLLQRGICKTDAENIASKAEDLLDRLRGEGYVLSYDHKSLMVWTEIFVGYDSPTKKGLVIIGNNTRHISNI